MGRRIAQASAQAPLMLSPASHPFLFDTSAESWLTRSHDPAVRGWFREYLSLYPVHISALTVVERIRGYALLWRRAQEKRRDDIETARLAYLHALGQVWPLDAAVGVVAGEIMALLPHPPPRRAECISSRNRGRSAWFAGASTA